jgi:hypothetical protein
MIRVSPSLEVRTLDFDAADPFYDYSPTGELIAWYVPTPSLMAWFAKMLERVASSAKKLTTNQLRDFERMKKSFASLSAEFPAGDTPLAPAGMAPSDFLETVKFVASSAPCLSLRDLAATVSSSFKHPPRRILAWRPTGGSPPVTPKSVSDGAS